MKSMEESVAPSQPAQVERFATWSSPKTTLLATTGIAIAAMLAFVYADSYSYLFNEWMENEDYGHGMFVPVISLALIWWRREHILDAGLSPSWWGLLPLLIGVGFYIVGELATLYVLQHLSSWLIFVGMVLAICGVPATRRMLFPLVYLLIMFPPPHMLQQSLSSSLQLISSALGVRCLQLIGVSAFREGNVIDLGPIQLQVVEACSGLRYLFPLLALTLLLAYLFQNQLWKRMLLVASAAPLAVLLNGLRIGVIGVLVDHLGSGAAEGFMHAFEGWFLFILSLGFLVIEVWLLSKVGVDTTAPLPLWYQPLSARTPAVGVALSSPPVVATFLVLVGLTGLSFPLAGRAEVEPPRQSFADFPMQLDMWHGQPMAMERQYIETLRFDDYLLADYQGAGGPVNVYTAYYHSQKKGQATHSPKTCIPGGGWEIASLEEMSVLAGPGSRAFRTNRVVIQKGNQKQIVYYWFKQRDRWITSEYLVKVFLFWDSITRNRTDGALVRLSSWVHPGENEAIVDERLQTMVGLVTPLLGRYVPD